MKAKNWESVERGGRDDGLGFMPIFTVEYRQFDAVVMPLCQASGGCPMKVLSVEVPRAKRTAAQQHGTAV